MPKPVTELPAAQVTPLPELEKRTRRTFTTEYKLRILAEADACAHGELGALLRREKLYSSQLAQWRREVAESGVDGLKKSAPGPVLSTTPEQRRMGVLEKEITRLNRQLQIAQDCVALQKKALQMFDHASSGSNV